MKRVAIWYFGAMVVQLAFSSVVRAEQFGFFRGNVQTEWLDPEGDHRRMKLLSDFAYVDPRGLEWHAPAGWIIDGASIPRLLWTLVGSPYDGAYRRASVIHDVACDRKSRPWKDVHRTFYYAMRAEGLDPVKAKVMYGAVYVGGPRWNTVTSALVAAASAPEVAAAMVRSLPAGTRGASVLISTRGSSQEPVPSPAPLPFPSPPYEEERGPLTEVAVGVEDAEPRGQMSHEEVDRLSALIEANPEISLEQIEQIVGEYQEQGSE
jgi:hypothetical protein